MEKKEQTKKHNIMGWMLGAILAVALAAGGTAAGWYWLFHMPCRVQADCRGQQIGVQQMERWEEGLEDGSMGIIRMAGWRTDRDQTVVSLSTGRKSRTQVICVYGSMELADPAPILAGRYGLAADKDYCVLSEELARSLFGSTDVAGEWIRTDQGKRLVAGVVELEEAVLMVPMEEGKAEQLAVEVRGRLGAQEKLNRLTEDK